ncbi:Uncharacterised protein [Moraxella lacunata]|uniref:Uncharacterized protein n=1 Tax=Moraxella lacunata TaxID=477 RepID=A0A1V4GYA5_MORLA|nr:hypothetical protein [Moraxella lacunata]OPH37622.1 hypothetical protein B5J94_05505 [Moraxella lacunata]STY99886.1 Uncharacterised protein [Moraxella lacunata]
MSLIQSIFRNLPKNAQVGIVAIVAILWVGIWVVNTHQDNSMQKQVNRALLSNQSIDVSGLLPNAKMICVVPKDTHIYNDTTGIYEYLSVHRLQSLNKIINGKSQIIYDDWHLVGVDNGKYDIYRMDDRVDPNFYGARCHKKSANQPLLLTPDKTSHGKKFDF